MKWVFLLVINKQFKTMTLTLTKYNKFALNYTAWTNEYKFEIWDTDGIHSDPGEKISLSFEQYIK